MLKSAAKLANLLAPPGRFEHPTVGLEGPVISRERVVVSVACETAKAAVTDAVTGCANVLALLGRVALNLAAQGDE